MTTVKRHCDLIRRICRSATQDTACTFVAHRRWSVARRSGSAYRRSRYRQRKSALYGDVSDVASLLSTLDAFSLASATEGMSNAILEAMACGLPVVATDVGGNLELIDDGRTGLLVPAGDPVALSTALERWRAIQHLRGHCGETARERVLAEFSLAKMAAAFQNLYRESRPDDQTCSPDVLQVRSSAGLYGADHVVLALNQTLPDVGVNSRMLCIENYQTERAASVRARARTCDGCALATLSRAV